MPSCVYRGCKNYTATAKDKNVSFHSLPRDELMKEKWLSVIRAQRREYDWLPTPYCKVCSIHFQASDIYLTDKNYQRIKKTAVPILKQDEQNIYPSPINIVQAQLSEDGTEIESPTTVILKKRIKQITLDKQKLKLKYYNLCRNYKRMKERCNSLKKLVSQLKKQNNVTITNIHQVSEIFIKPETENDDLDGKVVTMPDCHP